MKMAQVLENHLNELKRRGSFGAWSYFSYRNDKMLNLALELEASESKK